MNDHKIDSEKFAFYIHEANRMRAEAVRELLLASWSRIKGAATTIGKLARSLARRRKWNLSVPAPHR